VLARRRRPRPSAVVTALIVFGVSIVMISAAAGLLSGVPASAEPAPTMATPLATAVQSASGTWATLPMGHLDQPLNTFWQLFYRAAGTTSWSDKVEATAVGTNGGIVLATAPNQPLIAAVRPTNLLHFSPLIATTNGGDTWVNGLLPQGLAARPAALTTAATGQAFALVERGTGTAVLASTASLSTWTTLATSRQLAADGAGRRCGLQSVTAVVAFAGGATLGAGCRHPGVVGILEQGSAGWRLENVPLPGALQRDDAEVLSLGHTAYGLSGLLAFAGKRGSALVAGWTTGRGSWSISPPLPLAPGDHLVSVGPANGIGQFALWATESGAERLAVASGPGEAWQQMPAPPPGTATIVFSPTATAPVDALAAHGSTMTVWSLGPGPGGWMAGQLVPVKIEYGSAS
jgi:hypothetical protein